MGIKMNKRKHSLLQNLLKPVLTEKAMKIANDNKNGVFIFKVKPCASKTIIAEAIEKAFNVKVAQVRTITTGGTMHDKGKLRRKMGKGLEKKAIVTLKQGYNIFLGEF
jgi:large subunit ribosomal protein L23